MSNIYKCEYCDIELLPQHIKRHTNACIKNPNRPPNYCNNCGDVISKENEFFSTGRRKTYCDSCNLEIKNQWRKDNPEKQKEQSRKWMRSYYKRRPEVLLAARYKFELNHPEKFNLLPKTRLIKVDYLEEYAACRRRR